ncbi:MAG: aminotransferase class V-fold PLP-dependent enzyme [Bacteroidota bacterium]|nr:aminotransferase class V-fold PLP-dependent enzyme [Bacteroidota bacterium]MDP4193794.1 aminotransferase class V-fold PLP-dependent enzyme [Bacteroidota bacterium]
MNISESRSYFPYLKTGKIYMNHAAISPLSKPVVDALQSYIYTRSETEIENYFSFQRIVVDTKNKLAQMINTTSDRIAFADNTSNALNILAQSIDWKSGDRIILNDIEFPSNIYPFLNLKSYGVEIDFVKSHDGQVSFEDIEKALTPKTRLVSISHVQFLSGYKTDIEKIGQLCRQKGVIFCVDSIQALGAMREDVEKMSIDFLAAGTQKWLMSMQGLSVFYVRKELQEKLQPKFVGWTSVKDAWNLLDYDLTLREGADSFQNGTVCSIGIAALHATLDLMLSFGFDEIEKTILDNSEYFIEKLSDIGLNPILKGIERKYLSGIVSFKSEKAQEIFDELEKRNIVAAVREGVVRFSPHYYNNHEEIDKVVMTLKEII